jgi:hypothetical protein
MPSYLIYLTYKIIQVGILVKDFLRNCEENIYLYAFDIIDKIIYEYL